VLDALLDLGGLVLEGGRPPAILGAIIVPANMMMLHQAVQ